MSTQCIHCYFSAASAGAPPDSARSCARLTMAAPMQAPTRSRAPPATATMRIHHLFLLLAALAACLRPALSRRVFSIRGTSGADKIAAIDTANKGAVPQGIAAPAGIHRGGRGSRHTRRYTNPYATA
jgi:hypothetical protein